ncbi:hypothetical protein J2Y63_007016 [Shinella sp. BE166]|uniref:hypothetical protein n=1 Tax=Shinella sp. BE166 TaxID=3373918 RepID=UPI003EC12701
MLRFYGSAGNIGGNSLGLPSKGVAEEFAVSGAMRGRTVAKIDLSKVRNYVADVSAGGTGDVETDRTARFEQEVLIERHIPRDAIIDYYKVEKKW